MAKRWMMVSLVGLCMTLAGCSGSNAAPNKPPVTKKETSQPAPAAAASQTDFVAAGPIVVENQIDVAAQREGMVSAVRVDAGDHVRKGQLLANLDDRQITADRDAAVARMKSIEADVKNWEGLVKVAESDLRRAEEMRKADLTTAEQLEHERYKLVAAQFEAERERQNLKNSQSVLASLQLELEKTHIVSPFDGVVGRRYVRAGQKLAVGDRIFWITALKPLRVRFTLPESFIGRLHPGTQVSVTSQNVEGKSFPAKVIRVSPVVDASSGTIEVLAELTGTPAELRPGMTAQIHVNDPR